MDNAFPDQLATLHQIEFDYRHGDGIDFEPYSSFLSIEETQQWFSAWTGNKEADASKFLVFGQDGTGGYAAFFSNQVGLAVLEQPIVFLGSEGEVGVVARNFNDYLWVLASGHGPHEAIAYPDDEKEPEPAFASFSLQHSTTPQKPLSQILAAASASCPEFEAWVRKQCN